jgi:lipid-binding SYLF domain-containing protein
MRFKATFLAMTLFACAGLSHADQNRTDVTERLQSAATVIQNVEQAPDKGIPDEVFKGAKCVAVLPSMLKGGFILGAQHGRGVATCRLPDGSWSAPAFFVISGGSWGLQIGVEDVQLVMMVMTDEGMRHLMSDKFQIGASASASAGPVGRHASAGTDWKIDTDILTYSRSKGLFAGIDLQGSVIEQDKDSTIAMYGHDATTARVLDGHIHTPRSADPFVAIVRDTVSRAQAAVVPQSDLLNAQK